VVAVQAWKLFLTEASHLKEKQQWKCVLQWDGIVCSAYLIERTDNLLRIHIDCCEAKLTD